MKDGWRFVSAIIIRSVLPTLFLRKKKLRHENWFVRTLFLSACQWNGNSDVLLSKGFVAKKAKK